MNDRYYTCETCGLDVTACARCPECRRCPTEHAGTCSVGDRQYWDALIVANEWEAAPVMRSWFDDHSVLGVPQVVLAPRPNQTRRIA